MVGIGSWFSQFKGMLEKLRKNSRLGLDLLQNHIVQLLLAQTGSWLLPLTKGEMSSPLRRVVLVSPNGSLTWLFWLDLWWNPPSKLRAIGRPPNGQEQMVEVHRLITKGNHWRKTKNQDQKETLARGLDGTESRASLSLAEIVKFWEFQPALGKSHNMLKGNTNETRSISIVSDDETMLTKMPVM